MGERGSGRVDPAAFLDLEGLWRSRGYGVILEIGPGGYTLHEETAVSCLPAYGGTLEDLARHYEDLEVSSGGLGFSARRASGVTRLHFRRLARLPRTAREAGRTRDPLHVFDVFWHSFEEHYALFDLKGVDWDAMRDQYRSELTEDTPSRDLFATFCAMLTPLRDGHVHLRSPLGSFDAGAQPRLFRRLARELEDTDDTRSVASYVSELREQLLETIRERYLGGSSRRACSRLLEWGTLDERTGYLRVRAMAGLSGRVGTPTDDVAALDEAMGPVLEELGELPRMVVDVRGNGGGYDVVALRLAACFNDRKRLAFTKTARHAGTYTPPQPVHVRPHPAHRYEGEIVVLTSELTASAAEIFVLAMLQHSSLTLVGEDTAGILSDTLERNLPNGWFLTLSNELYRAHDDALYEDCGIPPHVRIPFLSRAERESDEDRALEHVLKRRRAD